MKERVSTIETLGSVDITLLKKYAENLIRIRPPEDSLEFHYSKGYVMIVNTTDEKDHDDDSVDIIISPDDGNGIRRAVRFSRDKKSGSITGYIIITREDTNLCGIVSLDEVTRATASEEGIELSDGKPLLGNAASWLNWAGKLLKKATEAVVEYQNNVVINEIRRRMETLANRNALTPEVITQINAALEGAEKKLEK